MTPGASPGMGSRGISQAASMRKGKYAMRDGPAYGKLVTIAASSTRDGRMHDRLRRAGNRR
ncbi:hypothetical protein CNECB9_5390020 [Cupriavidus necator]|uniref:Uncharacterized protein n=1 Tax=Cupriavidus necator TaxID=106590 RepID=A0A1K0J1Z3_CUPNE|nr:hypothetical protein CNECB9_5390020 [Cupriavidus necator]